MVKAGYTEVILKDDLAARLTERIEQEYTGHRFKPKLSSYVQDLLWEMLERDPKLQRYGPFLAYRGATDGRIRIQDNFLGSLVEIQIRDGKLMCLEDRRDDCLHVGFAFAVSEVHKVLMEHGFKPPKGTTR